MSSLIRLDQVQQFVAISPFVDLGHIKGKVVIPNYIRVILDWALSDGKEAHCIIGGTVGASFAPTPTVADAILTALTTGTNWSTLTPFLSTSSSLAAVTLRDIRAKDLPYVRSVGAGHPGSSVGTDMPNEIAAVITLRTNAVGQGNRGRMYIPGWASNAVAAGNTISATAMSALQTWANGIPGALSASGITFALAQPARAGYTSPKTGAVHDPRNATSLPITLQVVRDNHWDSQRRRGLK